MNIGNGCSGWKVQAQLLFISTIILKWFVMQPLIVSLLLFLNYFLNSDRLLKYEYLCNIAVLFHQKNAAMQGVGAT